MCALNILTRWYLCQIAWQMKLVKTICPTFKLLFHSYLIPLAQLEMRRTCFSSFVSFTLYTMRPQGFGGRFFCNMTVPSPLFAGYSLCKWLSCTEWTVMAIYRPGASCKWMFSAAPLKQKREIATWVKLAHGSRKTSDVYGIAPEIFPPHSWWLSSHCTVTHRWLSGASRNSRENWLKGCFARSGLVLVLFKY